MDFEFLPHLLAGGSGVGAGLAAWGAMRQRVAALAREVERLRTRDGEILAALGELKTGQAELKVEMKLRLDALDRRMERVEVVHGITPTPAPEAAR